MNSHTRSDEWSVPAFFVAACISLFALWAVGKWIGGITNLEVATVGKVIAGIALVGILTALACRILGGDVVLLFWWVPIASLWIAIWPALNDWADLMVGPPITTPDWMVPFYAKASFQVGVLAGIIAVGSFTSWRFWDR